MAITYQEYIKSPEWARKREERLRIDDYRCQCCGSKGSSWNRLEIHHITYRNVGHENIYTELVTLCKSCHMGVHSLMNRITDKSGRRGWKSCTPSEGEWNANNPELEFIRSRI